MKTRPDISIAIITYKHDAFIQDTLRGISQQKFSGTLEIIIGDDCSPDGTRKILEEFSKQHSNITLLFHKKNLGMVGNWLSVLTKCKGRYIAVCEGDDFWTTSDKLQLQFDFLENNTTYSMCWHPVEVSSEGVKRPYPYAESKEDSDIHDLILQHYIPTCSLMFRNFLIPTWPKWIHKALSFDIILEMLIGTKGKAKRINNEMGVYRQHPQGISKSNKHIRLGALNRLFILKKFNEYTSMRFDESVRKKMQEISSYQLKLKSLKNIRNSFTRLKLFYYHLYAKRIRNFRDLKHEAYLHLFPEIYNGLKK